MAIVSKSQGTEIGSYHFSAEKAKFEIQRGNNFEFIMTELDGIVAWCSDSKKFNLADDMIRLSVAASSVPHFSQDVITVRRGNTAVKYAGPINWDSGSLECYDFIGAETKDILMAWQSQSGDPMKQTVSQQSVYKKTCTLIEYSPDYAQQVRVWKLDGCWISQMSEDQYSQDANGARKINCTIQYDRAWLDYEA